MSTVEVAPPATAAPAAPAAPTTADKKKRSPRVKIPVENPEKESLKATRKEILSKDQAHAGLKQWLAAQDKGAAAPFDQQIEARKAEVTAIRKANTPAIIKVNPALKEQITAINAAVDALKKQRSAALTAVAATADYKRVSAELKARETAVLGDNETIKALKKAQSESGVPTTTSEANDATSATINRFLAEVIKGAQIANLSQPTGASTELGVTHIVEAARQLGLGEVPCIAGFSPMAELEQDRQLAEEARLRAEKHKAEADAFLTAQRNAYAAALAAATAAGQPAPPAPTEKFVASKDKGAKLAHSAAIKAALTTTGSPKVTPRFRVFLSGLINEILAAIKTRCQEALAARSYGAKPGKTPRIDLTTEVAVIEAFFTNEALRAKITESIRVAMQDFRAAQDAAKAEKTAREAARPAEEVRAMKIERLKKKIESCAREGAKATKELEDLLKTAA